MSVRQGRIRARHIAATERGTADYADAVALTPRQGDTRSPEQWARAAFEGAPPPMRWFLLAGWRAVLRLRLGPRPSAGHVLGWRIADADAETIRLVVESPLLDARLLLRVAGGSVVLGSRVSYARAIARPIWAVVTPVHRLAIPYLLGRAASRWAAARR